MTRPLWRRLATAAVLLGVASCGQVCVPTGPREGLRGPAFEARLLDGSRVRSGDLDDKPTVVVFWASWCGPCVHEIPSLNQLQAQVGEEVHVLGINAGEGVEAVTEAVEGLGVRYPVALDPDGRIRRDYQVEGIPLVVILDRDWRVRYRGNGLPLRVTSLLQGLGD